MRTTVTLDPDVEAKLKATMRERGVSFKAALNDAVRAGLAGEATPQKRFRVKATPMGARFNIDKALQVAGEMEDEEILRKLDMGK
ncbi:MAG TPA: CopG family transcriptional regulator [Solirubrobacteraceae bacterium]|jgi:hypothetical protein|nr:CopG family transcriptional regulator [Solirubrobacteraceae bacterium]